MMGLVGWDLALVQIWLVKLLLGERDGKLHGVLLGRCEDLFPLAA